MPSLTEGTDMCSELKGIINVRSFLCEIHKDGQSTERVGQAAQIESARGRCEWFPVLHMQERWRPLEDLCMQGAG